VVDVSAVSWNSDEKSSVGIEGAEGVDGAAAFERA